MSDAATVTQLIVKHRHGVVAYLYGVVPDYHAVEDIFQEVCLIAIQKAAEFQEGTNFVGWVRAIARNKIREHLRRRSGVLLDDPFFDGLDQAFDAARACGSLRTTTNSSIAISTAISAPRKRRCSSPGFSSPPTYGAPWPPAHSTRRSFRTSAARAASALPHGAAWAGPRWQRPPS